MSFASVNYKGRGGPVANALLMAGSLCLFLVFLEAVAFRFLFPASDIPAYTSVDGVVRREAGAIGVYRVRNEIAARYATNAQGWNSRHREYHAAKRPGEFRIAVVGDSFVEALQVDYGKSFAEGVEDMPWDRPVSVYRFGVGGAPMSQYVQVARNELSKYAPDVVVVLMIHNDFRESWRPRPGAVWDSFLTYRYEDGGLVERQPAALRSSAWEFVRHSATWRYLARRWQVDFQEMARKLLGPGEALAWRGAGRYAANIEAAGILSDVPLHRQCVRHTLAELDRACRNMGSRLLVVMDADRTSIYHGNEARSREAGPLVLNRIMAGETARAGIPLLDLHEPFAREYADRGRPFNFDCDGHWNAYAHGFVARLVADFLGRETRLSRRAT
ncbi:MAG: alginate O-acetyltransferase AlgX-related protein [Desulfatibacillaceae bacterium]